MGLSSDIQFHLLKNGTDNTLDRNIELVKLYEAATDLAGKRNTICTANIAEEETPEPPKSDDYSEMRAELEAMKTMVWEMRNPHINLGRLTRPRAMTQQTRGMASSRCFSCGQDGHFARDCHQKAQRMTGAECYKCHQPGHISRNCPTNQYRGQNVGIRTTVCERCHYRGHHESVCFTDLRKECQGCGKKGHIMQEFRSKQRQPYTEATKNGLAPAVEGANGWA